MVTTITENGVTFNKTSAEASWRLFYGPGDTEAILVHLDGFSMSVKTIEEFVTEQEGLNRIHDLGMTRKVPAVRPAE